GINIARISLSFTNESQQSIKNLGGKSEVNLVGGVYQQLGGRREFSFSKISAEFVRYFPTFSNQMFIARFAGEFARPFSHKSIPFYYLNKMDGHENIRGFGRGRFYGTDLIWGSLEYRFPILRHSNNCINGMIFTDFGQISQNIFRKFSENRVKVTYGFGIDFQALPGVKTMIGIGKSSDGIRLKFDLN
ncbi:MAG: hypothetical protein GWN16_15875, partial [Calditrichae bacterium]|nr:hypothetical protein [Calditrichia bacterium]